MASYSPYGLAEGALVSPPLDSARRPSLAESASMMQTPSSSRKRAFDASSTAAGPSSGSRPPSPVSSSTSSSPTDAYHHHGYAPMPMPPATPFASPVRGGPTYAGHHQTHFGAMAMMSPPFGTPMQHPQLAAVMQTPSSAGSDTRPDLKRRKTAPPAYLGNGSSPPTPSTPCSPEKRGNGKDGQEVWPPLVEEVFMEALRTVPKLGRRKVLVDGKPCGRNELISIFIKKKTGVDRSRKQVSSHIQVLKNVHKGDASFLTLVAEPAEGEDNFNGLCADIFGQVSRCGINPIDSDPPHFHSIPTFPATPPTYPSTPQQPMTPGGGLLAPSPMGSGAMMYRSRSAGTSPLHSPATPGMMSDNLASPMTPGPPSASLVAPPMSAGRTLSQLAHGLDKMSFPHSPGFAPPPPPQPQPTVVRDGPVLLSTLQMRSTSVTTGHTHLFFEIEKPATLGAKPKHEIQLAELQRTGSLYTSKLEPMTRTLDCAFHHVRLNLALPWAEHDTGFQHLEAELRLVSPSVYPLVCVTTVYSMGEQILRLVDPCLRVGELRSDGPAATVAADAYIEGAGGSSSSSSSSSPRSAKSTNSPVTPEEGQEVKTWHEYRAPWAHDFWNIFLRGANYSTEGGPPTFAKFQADRFAIGSATDRVAIMQEFVIQRPGTPLEQMVATVPADHFSAGSVIGEVMLAVVYEPSYLEAMTVSAEVSTIVHPNRPQFHPTLQAHLNMAAMAPRPVTPIDAIHPALMAPPSGAGSFGGKRRSARPPGLNLSIPTAAAVHTVDREAQFTPLPQMVHTPTHPPPLQQPSSPTSRDRLMQHWQSQANAAGLNPADYYSPALMGSFQQQLDQVQPPPVAPASDMPPVPTIQHPTGAAISALTAEGMGLPTPSLAHFPGGSHGEPFRAQRPAAASLAAAALTDDATTTPSSLAEAALADPSTAGLLGLLAYAQSNGQAYGHQMPIAADQLSTLAFGSPLFGGHAVDGGGVGSYAWSSPPVPASDGYFGSFATFGA